MRTYRLILLFVFLIVFLLAGRAEAADAKNGAVCARPASSSVWAAGMASHDTLAAGECLSFYSPTLPEDT